MNRNKYRPNMIGDPPPMFYGCQTRMEYIKQLWNWQDLWAEDVQRRWDERCDERARQARRAA